MLISPYRTPLLGKNQRKMTFGFTECAAIAAYIVLVFMKMYPMAKSDKKEDMEYWGWRIMRCIMGALLVVTFFYFTQNAVADSWQLILGFTLLVVFVVLKKMYCAARHANMVTQPIRITYLIVMLLIGAVILVAMCVEPAGDLWPVNVACFAAYLVLFVMKMIYWIYHHNKNLENLESSIGSRSGQGLRRSLLPK